MAIQHERTLLMMMSKIHNKKKKKKSSAPTNGHINYCQAIVQYSQQTIANENPT
jgi:hypothetical protein